MKIYLAALESNETYHQIAKGLIENGFFSYYYMRGKALPLTLEIARGCGMRNIIIDSGAHSFFVQSDSISAATNHKSKNKLKDTPTEYMEKYFEWVKQNWCHFDYFVELDIGEIVGQPQVLAWRERMKQENLYRKCIPVFHPAVMNFDDYIHMIETVQSGYVGIEGIRQQGQILPYRKYIKEAYLRGVKIHGFAMTKKNQLDEFPFYSVDSNSWKSGVMYGAGLMVTDHGIETVRYKNKDDFGLSAGKINVDVVLGDTYSALSEIILAETTKSYRWMQEYYTTLWTNRNIKW